MAQGCSPLAHLHSSDLHPWPHRTDLHLTRRKNGSNIARVEDAQIHSEYSTQMCHTCWAPSAGGRSLECGFVWWYWEWINYWGGCQHTKCNFIYFTVSLAELYYCMYAHMDSPALAEKAHSLETFLWGPSQGSTGGSQGGGGLLEPGCVIQGGSALNGPALPSLVTDVH